MKPTAITLICIALVQLGVCLPFSWAITLEELQEQAVQNRDLVKRYEADLAIKTQAVKETKGAFYPSLDIGYTLNRLNHNSRSGEYRENDYFQAGATWNAFAGFKDYYDLKAAQAMTDYGRYQIKGIKQDIKLKVALQYLELYRQMKNLKVSEDERKLFKDRLRQIKLKYEVGVLKKSDVLKVKVEMDNALQKERRAQSSVAGSINLLTFETGLTVNRGQLDFETFHTLPEKKSFEDYEDLLFKNRSELGALRSSLTASGHRIKSAKSDLYPRADLSVTYNSFNRTNYFLDSFENSNDEVRCQATISINLFDGLQKHAKISQAVLEEKQVSYDITELEESLLTSLKNSIIARDVAFKNLEVAESGTKEAQENLRVTDLSFDQGIATSSDVLDAIFNLSRARYNLIFAHSEIFLNDFQLQRLVESF